VWNNPLSLTDPSGFEIMVGWDAQGGTTEPKKLAEPINSEVTSEKDNTPGGKPNRLDNSQNKDYTDNGLTENDDVIPENWGYSEEQSGDQNHTSSEQTDQVKLQNSTVSDRGYGLNTEADIKFDLYGDTSDAWPGATAAAWTDDNEATILLKGDGASPAEASDSSETGAGDSFAFDYAQGGEKKDDPLGSVFFGESSIEATPFEVEEMENDLRELQDDPNGGMSDTALGVCASCELMLWCLEIGYNPLPVGITDPEGAAQTLYDLNEHPEKRTRTVIEPDGSITEESVLGPSY
jgi:hypothetical protein